MTVESVQFKCSGCPYTLNLNAKDNPRLCRQVHVNDTRFCPQCGDVMKIDITTTGDM